MNKVTEYIQNYPEPVQERLNKILSIIKDLAPQAEEGISYGIIGFKLNGRYFIYFGAFKNHCSVYPFPSGVERFQKAAQGYKTAKGTVQIPHNKPLPIKLIKDIVKFRIQESLS